jgi:hypothetical protein
MKIVQIKCLFFIFKNGLQELSRLNNSLSRLRYFIDTISVNFSKTSAMQTRLRSTFTQIIAASLIFLFLYAAVSKLLTHSAFTSVLGKSPLLGRVSKLVAWLVPLTEIGLAILLFIPSFRKLGLLLSIFLMSLFTIYIAYMLLFIPQLPCSCGGVVSSLDWKEHLVFNCCVTLVACIGWKLSKTNKDFIAINRISRTPVKDSRQI